MAKYSATQDFYDKQGKVFHAQPTVIGGGTITYPDSDTLAQLAKRITMAHTLPSMDKRHLHQSIYVRRGKRTIGMYHLIDNKLKLQRKMNDHVTENKRRDKSYKAMDAIRRS